MTIEQAKDYIKGLKERFDAPYSPKDKNLIEQLYYEVLAKEFVPTTCQNCYHDAVIEIAVYLKNNNKMAEKCNYRLRAGFIIHCPTFHNGAIYTNDNLTDAIAEKYLEAYPKNEDMFQQLPQKKEEKVLPSARKRTTKK